MSQYALETKSLKLTLARRTSESVRASTDAVCVEAVIRRPPSLNTPAHLINSPAVTAVDVDDGATVNPASLSGGAIESGTDWLTFVTHYGSMYGGSNQEILVIDANAHTLQDGFVFAGTPTFWGWTIADANATVISASPQCAGTPVSGWHYTFTGSGAGATL